MKIKSPISRIGGKGMISGWLRGFIPEHTCYVEPFAGGASLLFSKEPAKVEVLNDIDNDLVSFYQGLKQPEIRQQMIEVLDSMPYARTLWNDIRLRWKHGKRPDDFVKRLAEWFFLNRSSFAGDQKRGGFAVPSATGRNPARSYQNAINSLEAVAGRLRGVTIECLPYQECIRRYDSPGTFFYCDPPYLENECYYGSKFTENDHYRLSELLHGIQGRCMVSHYQNSLYDSLYGDFNCYRRSSFKGAFKSSGEKKPETVEVVYCNFEPAVNRSLFDAVE